MKWINTKLLLTRPMRGNLSFSVELSHSKLNAGLVVRLNPSINRPWESLQITMRQFSVLQNAATLPRSSACPNHRNAVASARIEFVQWRSDEAITWCPVFASLFSTNREGHKKGGKQNFVAPKYLLRLIWLTEHFAFFLVTLVPQPPICYSNRAADLAQRETQLWTTINSKHKISVSH